MGSFHHRDPGLIGLLGRRDGATRPHGHAPLDALTGYHSDDDVCEATPRVTLRPQLLTRRDIGTALHLSDEWGAGAGAGAGAAAQRTPRASHMRHGSACRRVYYSIIVDGIHCHRYSASMVHRLHPSGLVLVTDAMAAMGLPPGRHNLGTMKVDIFDGKDGGGKYDGLHAVIANSDTLAGALLPLDGCVRNLREFSGCSRVQAVEAATLHPAQVLGLRNYVGELVVGARADLVMMDDALNVKQTYINGVLAYQAHELEK